MVDSGELDDWFLELGPNDAVPNGWITAGVPSDEEYQIIHPLPQKCVLCVDLGGCMHLGYYIVDAKGWFSVITGHEIAVKAWQPLARPYKGGKNDN